MASEIFELLRPFPSKFRKVQYFFGLLAFSPRMTALLRGFTQIWCVLADFSTPYKTSIKLARFVLRGRSPEIPVALSLERGLRRGRIGVKFPYDDNC